MFPGTLQLICHYHFVKDLGKAVFGNYPDLRSAMIYTNDLAYISGMELPEKGEGVEYAENLWIAIAAEYILYPRTIPSKFPFVLPYFEVLKRCIEIEEMLVSITRWNAFNLKLIRPVSDIYRMVREITHDPTVMENYRIITRAWSWFENVRESLKVSRKLSSSESSSKPVNIEEIGKDLNLAISEIMNEGKSTGGELKRISRIFRNRVEDHREELLSPVIGDDGKTIAIVRHNGIEEIGHRWSRMHIRRRTGRSQTTREMGKYGALTAVLSNMENKQYIEKVLSRTDFLKEFTSITKEEIDKSRKLIRPNPCEPILRKDMKRKPVLCALVKILETHETLPETELKAWIESIKI